MDWQPIGSGGPYPQDIPIIDELGNWFYTSYPNVLDPTHPMSSDFHQSSLSTMHPLDQNDLHPTPSLSRSEQVQDLNSSSEYEMTTVHNHHPQPSLQVGDATQPTAIVSMGPPTKPRKKKAPTLRAEHWEPYKDRIRELLIEQDIPLPKVKEEIEKQYGFVAELRQYKYQIKKWKDFSQNVGPADMQAIVKINQKRKLEEPGKGRLGFRVRGNEVDPAKIQRWMGRHGIPEDISYSPSPGAPTPSAVSYWTTSEVGTPMDISSSTPQTPLPLPSPALSISSIVRSGNRKFQGQSPAPFVPATIDLSNNHKEVSKKTILQDILQGTRARSPGSFLTINIPQSASDPLHGVVSQHPMRTSLQRDMQDDEDRFREKLRTVKRKYGEQSGPFLSHLRALGDVLVRKGRYKAAEETARKAVRISEGLQDTYSMAISYLLLGRALSFQGFYQESDKTLKKAIAVSNEELGGEHKTILTIIDALASNSRFQGRYKEAEELGKENLKTLRRTLGTKHYLTISSMKTLSDVLYEQERYEESEELQMSVVELCLETRGEHHHQTLIAMSNLALSYKEQGRLEDAKNLAIYVLEGMQNILGKEHSSTLEALGCLAGIYSSLGRLNEAEKLASHALDKLRNVLGNDHPNTIYAEARVVMIYAAQEKFEESIDMRRQVIDNFKRVLGPNHPAVMREMAGLSSYLKSIGRVEEAVTVLRERLRLQMEGLGSEAIATTRTLDQRRRWGV